jgi:hypothetical protein
MVFLHHTSLGDIVGIAHLDADANTVTFCIKMERFCNSGIRIIL